MAQWGARWSGVGSTAGRMVRLQQPMEETAIRRPSHDQGIKAPVAPGAADKKGQHAASEDEVKALRAKAHPL
jgi:hypothetical protein